MSEKEKVIYNGRIYQIQSSGRYYIGSGNPRLLHRKVWTDHYGEIPKGFVIHHKDHNWRNNNISNLELMERQKHYRDHALEKHQDEEYTKNNRIHLNKIRDKTKIWHKSQEGIIWHKEHAKKGWINRPLYKITCRECSKEHMTAFPSRTFFCSKKCSQKRQHEKYITAIRNCIECKSEFITHRHRKIGCCGYSCAAKRKARIRKEQLLHDNI